MLFGDRPKRRASNLSRDWSNVFRMTWVGEAPGNLPLLEFALAMLWQQQQNRMLTHDAYEEIARVEGALTRHADQVFDALGADEQEIARRTFIQLVRPGEGTEDTRRVARREELDGEAWALVQQLADARLVVTGRDAFGSETVEVVHEALICNWGKIREWMEADRSFRMWQERLRASMRQWEASGHNEGALLRGVPLAEAEGWLDAREVDLGMPEITFIRASIDLREQRATERENELLARERQRQRILQGLLAGLVIVVLLLALAGWQFLRAEEQRQAASSAQTGIVLEREQAQMALSRQLATQAAALQADQLDLSLLLSIEANRIAETVEARRSLRSGWHLTRGWRDICTGTLIGSQALSTVPTVVCWPREAMTIPFCCGMQPTAGHWARRSAATATMF